MFYIKLDSGMNLVVTSREPLYRGDHLSQKLTFLIPTKIGDLDMASATLYLSYIRADGTADIDLLKRGEELYNESYYQFTMPVTSKLTRYAGPVTTFLTIYSGAYNRPRIAKSGECILHMLICYVLAKPFKPYLDLWMEERKRRGIDSEWLFTDVHDKTQPITVSRMNSFARTFSSIIGEDVYLHSLRHFMTSELARANIPDSVIQSLIGWDSADMVGVYKDIDADEEFGKYFKDGEIVAQKQAGLGDL